MRDFSPSVVGKVSSTLPISLDRLMDAARRHTATQKQTLDEARRAGVRTAFLCHSHQDEALVRGAATLLQESGWRVYVDWTDVTMPLNPNRETADRIKARIAQMNFFLFLATPNSVASRWCPWEIGYADAVKGYEAIFVIPTADRSGVYYGNEYLQLYRNIDEAAVGGLAAWHPGRPNGGTYVRDL